MNYKFLTTLIFGSLIHLGTAMASDFESPCNKIEQYKPDTSPAFIDSVEIEYPELAFVGKFDGVVSVKVAVNADGSVCDVIVIEGVMPLQ